MGSHIRKSFDAALKNSIPAQMECYGLGKQFTDAVV